MPSPDHSHEHSIKYLDKNFQFLDQLPDKLYKPIITLHHGNLQQRVSGILQWRQSLLTGKLPLDPEIEWPEQKIKRIIIEHLDGIDIIALCKNEESLVDEILVYVCAGIESVIRQKQQKIHQLFDDLLDHPFRQKENTFDLEPNEADTPDVDAPSSHSENNVENHQPQDDNVNQQNYKTDSNPQLAENRISSNNQPPTHPDTVNHHETVDIFQLNDYYLQSFKQIKEKWLEVNQIFKSMGITPGRGWDLSHGVLVSQGWKDIIQNRKKIKHHPQLIKIVNSLGRNKKASKNSLDDITKSSSKSDGLESAVNIKSTTTTPQPESIQGIIRSDDIARMLPSEAALLTLPTTRLLWHARRMEHALLSYHAEGVLSTHIPAPHLKNSHSLENKVSTAGEQDNGPIIICIDSSGSMRGIPEKISKAIVLEVLRLAGGERRACYLFSFSGSGQTIEHQLEFSQAGLKKIIQFLQLSFHGGTDVSNVVLEAYHKIKQKHWKKADVLLVTDGIFQLEKKQISTINTIKQRNNIRMQGLIISGWINSSIKQICQPVHTFNENMINTSITLTGFLDH